MDGYRASGVEVGVGYHISGSPDTARSKFHVSTILHFHLMFVNVDISGDFRANVYITRHITDQCIP